MFLAISPSHLAHRAKLSLCQLGVSTGVLRRVLRMLALTLEEMQREIFATC